MFLYHFLPSKWALNNIANRRIRISRFSALNDPFELLLFACDNREQRQALADVKLKLGQERGLICLCKNWRNPLMWSHYADRHKGICLGFEVSPELVTPVRYVSSRPKFNMSKFFGSESEAEALMAQNLTTKFSHWRYEQECRAFVGLDHSTIDSDGNYFLSFSRDFRLRKVIVGTEARVSRLDVATAISAANYEHPILSFRARAAFKSFAIVRNRNESMWT